VKVVFSRLAHRQTAERRTWWRKHRTSKSAFTEEVKEVGRILKDAPKLAVHGVREGLEVRRLNLSRIHCYAYYTIDEKAGVVEVIALWGQEVANQSDFVDED
jgi:hypothetical protein